MKYTHEQDECNRLYQLAEAVLGNTENVTRWMTSTNIWTLDNQMPVELLMSEEGREQVENVLVNLLDSIA